jgi:hypothetical protein
MGNFRRVMKTTEYKNSAAEFLDIKNLVTQNKYKGTISPSIGSMIELSWPKEEWVTLSNKGKENTNNNRNKHKKPLGAVEKYQFYICNVGI